MKCNGCDEGYAVLQPLTSCSATVTFLPCEPSCSDAVSASQQLQNLHHSNTDTTSYEKKCTVEFMSSVLCSMPVLSCNSGMSNVSVHHAGTMLYSVQFLVSKKKI